MKLYLILLTFLFTDPASIARINKLKSEAEKAFQNKDYQTAALKYGRLADSLGVDESPIRLNLGHSYFQLGDTTNAKNNYQSASSSSDPKLKSIAYQQLGVMAKNTGNLQESLQFLKSSIKSDPTNEGARYDYEVVKKQIQQQQENQQNQDKKQEPSEFAKALKKKSDELRSIGKFAEALQIMQKGMEQDPTIKSYSDYIERLSKVAGI